MVIAEVTDLSFFGFSVRKDAHSDFSTEERGFSFGTQQNTVSTACSHPDTEAYILLFI